LNPEFNNKIVQNKKILKWIIFIFPVIFCCFILLLKWKSSYYYRELAWKEDSLLEYLTAIFYFAAFCISITISSQFYKCKLYCCASLYYALTAGLFFVAMEEISWGQRILRISTPAEFSDYNYQNEINIHNINNFPLHSLYIFVGLYGGIIKILLPNFIKIRYRAFVKCVIPDYYLSFYFLVVAFLYLYYDHFSPFIVSILGDKFGWGPGRFIHGKDQEPAEFLLSLGFLLFVLINRFRLKLLMQDMVDSYFNKIKTV
jgi:hypothetical protein